MRDRTYLAGFLLVTGLVVYWGRNFIQQSAVVTWGLTFAGTAAVGVLAAALYRVQLELRASRHELARKEAELSFAMEVQQALFPRQFPADSGLEFAGMCVPARGISGDYYDVMQLSDGRLVFAIADISGKGISAAILMSNLQAVLRLLTQAGHTPAAISCQLNRHMLSVTAGTRFATFFYSEWIQAERRLIYFNAGHNAPILLNAEGVRRLTAGGPPLGVISEADFQVGEATLKPTDMIVLFSDGITEAGVDAGQEFGDARLEALVCAQREKPLAEIQRQVLEAVRQWSGREPEDDMTLLLVRATGVMEEAV